MGRAALIIDKDRLKEEIDRAEAAQTFENQSRLLEYLCTTDFAKSIKDSTGKIRTILPGNLYSKIKEYGLTVKTAKGKKGGNKPGKRAARGRRSNAKEMIASTPKEFKHIAEKAADGSMKATIKLHCLQCCCFVASEVKACQIKTCGWWDWLPRDKKTKSQE